MIWVLSGTFDGAEIIRLLKKKGVRVFATAVTEYGAALSLKAGAERASSGALTCDGMMRLIRKNKVTAVVDATHPFAVEASANAMKACKKTGIKYLRYERRSARVPASRLVHYAKDFREAGKKAAKLGDIIFYTGGSKNLGKFFKAAGKRKKVIAKVLPCEESIKKCAAAGVTAENIVAVMGAGSEEFNKALFREYMAAVVVLKESGEAGGTGAKVRAALSFRMPVVIVKRPRIKYDSAVDDYSEVVKWITAL